jgi:translation initiation factor 5B
MEINSKNYWEKNDDSDYVNIIPTSAITGEGMPDLLGYICHTA